MAIVKLMNKKNGVVYVYESKSYWDSEKQQARNKRKLIGKVDPETGEIIPTAGRGRPRKEKPVPAETEEQIRIREADQKRIIALSQEVGQKDQLIHEQKEEIAALKERIADLKKLIDGFSVEAGKIIGQ